MDGAKEDLVDMFIVHTCEEIQVSCSTEQKPERREMFVTIILTKIYENMCDCISFEFVSFQSPFADTMAWHFFMMMMNEDLLYR